MLREPSRAMKNVARRLLNNMSEKWHYDKRYVQGRIGHDSADKAAGNHRQ
jgi:hypothetical protein